MARVYDNATDIITFARLQSQNTTSGSSYLGSDGLLKFAAEDEPRIEYGSDGSLKGLLIEEQRTNLLQYSEDFSQSYWLKDAAGTGSTPVVAASSLTDPAGGTGAYEVVYDAGAGTSGVDQSMLQTSSIGITIGTDYTHSIWVRGDVGGEQIVVRGVGNSAYDLFTLTTDWTRISATETATVTVGYLNFGIRQAVQGTINSTATIHIYGAQLEQGSFATSYIPTSGSQKTRDPDIASIPVSAFGYNQEAGTVVVEFGAFSVGSLNAAIASLTDDPVSDDWAPLLYLGPSSLEVRTRDTGVDQAVITILGDFRTSGGIVGTAMKENSFAASVNGSTPITYSSGTMPTDVSIMRIGTFASNPAYLNGHIKSIKYYPRRLTDAQLQELTA